MGYDLYWTEDPYGEWREHRADKWRLERSLFYGGPRGLAAGPPSGVVQGTSLVQLTTDAAELYHVLQSDGAYFRASMNTAHVLLYELEYQGATGTADHLRRWADVPAEVLRLEVPHLRRAFYATLEAWAAHGVGAVDEVHPLEEYLDHVVPEPAEPEDLMNENDAAEVIAHLRSSASCPSCGQGLHASETWAERWARFVDFLQGAAEHGGVRVT